MKINFDFLNDRVLDALRNTDLYTRILSSSYGDGGFATLINDSVNGGEDVILSNASAYREMIENDILISNQAFQKVLLVDEDIIGWYFCCNKNEGIKIIDIDIDTNELILEQPNPEDIPPAEIEDGQVIRPAGVEYVYVEVNNKMPELHTGNRNEVCTVDGVAEFGNLMLSKLVIK